ncbi:MAG: hypothetical protein FWG93_02330 [Oscillospiraceae bacterium]|nr:hypothetical protein [Oscillospiraceae bacterium]
MESGKIRRKDGAGCEIRPGDVVESRSGRDAGRRMLVLTVRDEASGPDGQGGVYLELADGRIRRVEKPKRKKAKHVSALSGTENPETETALACLDRTAEKLRGGGTASNSEVRRALNAYAEAYGFDTRRDADVKG